GRAYALARAGTCRLSLPDALPISGGFYPCRTPRPRLAGRDGGTTEAGKGRGRIAMGATAVGRRASRYSGRARPASRLRGEGLSRSEEHTSELQSRENLVCRLLLEK